MQEYRSLKVPALLRCLRVIPTRVAVWTRRTIIAASKYGDNNYDRDGCADAPSRLFAQAHALAERAAVARIPFAVPVDVLHGVVDAIAVGVPATGASRTRLPVLTALRRGDIEGDGFARNLLPRRSPLDNFISAEDHDWVTAVRWVREDVTRRQFTAILTVASALGNRLRLTRFHEPPVDRRHPLVGGIDGVSADVAGNTCAGGGGEHHDDDEER